MVSGVVLLTDRRAARGDLRDVVAQAVAGGVRCVVLREKDLPRVERLVLAAELRPILAEAGGTLIVAGPDPLLPETEPAPRIPSTFGGAFVALHLPAAGPYPPPVADLVGRSCHDEAELDRLTTEDYVTLSPVFPTRSKPGHGPPLGPDGLAALVGRSPVPVLALGGIETPAQVRACVEAGATGVAVQGAIMRARDPHQVATTLTIAHHELLQKQPPAPPHRPVPTGNAHDGLRPTVPTQGSSLTARSGHGRPQP
ncbi:thiamine phosphate synthase [Verrucosispora sp. NA02020]|uniref:thiamine phosphate synthase n=1 Tax=Verrucosispora sp. NA02020 TaxID=2742132 RepID=UPI003D75BAB7